MGDTDLFCSTGFSGNNKRELLVWDRRKNNT
jgi:hypothetical protein